MQDKRKILIIRLSSIGDIVLTTPIIRCLKNDINCEIHYITKKVNLQILESNPYIDNLIEYKATEELYQKLRDNNYDYILDLHKNIRSRRIKRAVKVKYLSFDKLNFKKWVLVNLKINKLPKIHIVDRYFNAVNSLGVKNDNKGLDYFIDEHLMNEVDKLIANKKPYIAIAVGSKQNTKVIPKEKIAYLAQNINSHIILLGGYGDIDSGEYIRKQSPNNVDTYCGKLTLNETAYMVKNADYIITPDTGVMHIASAFHKKIISIWGSTVSDFGMFPYYADEESEIFEVNNLRCRPCSKIGFKKCPKKHFKCMMDIDYDKIIDKINNRKPIK